MVKTPPSRPRPKTAYGQSDQGAIVDALLLYWQDGRRPLSLTPPVLMVLVDLAVVCGQCFFAHFVVYFLPAPGYFSERPQMRAVGFFYAPLRQDRKSTRLNSSHVAISY